jgi:hypothetical protein
LLFCKDSSSDKFLIRHLFDAAEVSTLEEASIKCVCLERNNGIMRHVAALGEVLNIKPTYEVSGESLGAETGRAEGGKTRALDGSCGECGYLKLRCNHSYLFRMYS